MEWSERRKHTADVEACHGEFRWAAEELGREVLNAVADGGDGVGVHVVEARV